MKKLSVMGLLLASLFSTTASSNYDLFSQSWFLDKGGDIPGGAISGVASGIILHEMGLGPVTADQLREELRIALHQQTEEILNGINAAQNFLTSHSCGLEENSLFIGYDTLMGNMNTWRKNRIQESDKVRYIGDLKDIVDDTDDLLTYFSGSAYRYINECPDLNPHKLIHIYTGLTALQIMFTSEREYIINKYNIHTANSGDVTPPTPEETQVKIYRALQTILLDAIDNIVYLDQIGWRLASNSLFSPISTSSNTTTAYWSDAKCGSSGLYGVMPCSGTVVPNTIYKTTSNYTLLDTQYVIEHASAYQYRSSESLSTVFTTHAINTDGHRKQINSWAPGHDFITPSNYASFLNDSNKTSLYERHKDEFYVDFAKSVYIPAENSIQNWMAMLEEYYQLLDPVAMQSIQDSEPDVLIDFTPPSFNPNELTVVSDIQDYDLFYNYRKSSTYAGYWLNDTDKDGISADRELFHYKINPWDKDSDRDYMDDNYEVTFGTSLRTIDTSVDLDFDGYSNYAEYLAYSDPNNALSTPITQKAAKMVPVIALLLN